MEQVAGMADAAGTTAQQTHITTDAIPRSTSKTPAPMPPPIQREQREKKDSFKKREAAGSTASSLGKRKAQDNTTSYPSPQRYAVIPPPPTHYDPPREDVMVEHETTAYDSADVRHNLHKPMDLAENKRGYRYIRAIADPSFPHKQFYRSTSPGPHCAKLSFEDADKWMHFSKNGKAATNEKGWRMARANVCAREGTMYYEIKIHKGIPASGPMNEAVGPAPHVRFGWARREAPLDAPVGFDGYSYGLTDMRFETMHRSRPGKFFHSKKGPKAKSLKAAATPATITLAPEDQHIKEGDVIGVEIQLPSLNLHQKIVSGVYNPAVDIGTGFSEPGSGPELAGPDDTPADVIRDRIPVAYKGQPYFEILDYVSTKPMENYADRTMSASTLSGGGPTSMSKDAVKTAPNPNHEHVALRTLPHSAIRVYKNGNLVGTAFENLFAFLPPASQPSKQLGAREGDFDDGMIGYYPAVACFFGGVAELNFGDGEGGFWAAPAHIRAGLPSTEANNDVEMIDADAADNAATTSTREGWVPRDAPRPVGDRYKEQVAEDILWDIIDEVDFYVQDGGDEKTAQRSKAS